MSQISNNCLKLSIMYSSHIIVWNHQLLWILRILLMRLSKESLCCSALDEYLCSSNWLFSGTYEMVSENGTKSYPQCRNRTTSFTVANVYKFHLPILSSEHQWRWSSMSNYQQCSPWPEGFFDCDWGKKNLSQNAFTFYMLFIKLLQLFEIP